jgi:hypothetical protein
MDPVHKKKKKNPKHKVCACIYIHIHSHVSRANRRELPGKTWQNFMKIKHERLRAIQKYILNLISNQMKIKSMTG